MDFHQTGIIGPKTWSKIVEVYNGEIGTNDTAYPGYLIRAGMRGNDVLTMQRYLNKVGNRYPSIPRLEEDGIFGANTEKAVTAFQRQFGLEQDRNNRTNYLE